MNKTEIKKALKEKIQANKQEWANMWIVKEAQLLKPEPDQAEISKAELKMQECNDRIELLSTLLKRCGSSESE